MRKLIVGFLVFVILGGAAAVSLLTYVKPTEQLDLSYTQPNVKEKALEMLKRRHFSLLLYEEELNHLLKKALLAHASIPAHTTLEGARFRLDGELLYADLNLTYRHFPVGMTAQYRLRWQPPEVQGVYEAAMIKNIRLPAGLVILPNVSLPVENLLPSLVGVREVVFLEDAVEIQFNLGRK
ncbi:hypothetical protein [Paenibacillus turpanensis]|uniref:hypothetical protein n=1 Tax=Paenibacillus turpanensis TaxID=2689078 RepID=UPI00140B38F3|nr:hypothetical protein [Paenibacillus turpanensis]